MKIIRLKDADRKNNLAQQSPRKYTRWFTKDFLYED